MVNIWIGLIAAFIATVILSILMLMKQSIRLMPEMDLIGMMSEMMHVSRAMGWLVHFIVGTVMYGGFFAWVLVPLLSDVQYWLVGVVLGIIGWLIAMVVMMPMGGKGFFGIKLGMMGPVMSFIMHVFFGAILGWVYGLMIR